MPGADAVPRELETPEELDAALAAGDLRGHVLQALDLTGRGADLLAVPVEGTVFLGCALDPGTETDLRARGALLFPALRGLPYAPYRNRLYTSEELYAGFDPDDPASYAACLDARVYAHWKETGGASPPSIVETLARRLHDHAISDALEEVLARDAAGRAVVAVMGGHSMRRDDPAFADVVRLSRDLTRRDFFMASGGGPGAMEATNLGAWVAPREDGDLAGVLELLGSAPSYTDPGWLSAAFRVRHAYPLEDRARGASLGIPTWLYGHEPPNAFATHVAKYFANAVREEGLLSLARGGVVFSPGSAGTIQEVFQDACQNHYESMGPASPMVFLGVDYWTRVKPVYPLLEGLAAGKPYARWLRITDDLAEVVATLEEYRDSAPLS